MSQGTLPHRVNIRKAVIRGARYTGTLGYGQLPQYKEQLTEVDTGVELTLQFGEDEEGRQHIAATLRAAVSLECQRCLGRVEQVVTSNSRLALVHNDEQARALPASYEPWIAVDEVDLWDIAAEELALALPVVAYHPEAHCNQALAAHSRAVSAGGQESEGNDGDNPFSVLASLLEGGADEEK